MLKILDILIGVTTVMLLFSMAVTVITQFVMSVLGSRGRNLRNGLTGLLRQLDPTLEEKVAKTIATAVLKHPLIADPMGRLGSVIHREELTTLLMGFAAGHTPGSLEETANTALTQLLQKNGIADPAKTLSDVRELALQLETSNPELATDVRHSMAILQEAKSEFVAKIHAWFDQTIDRVSQRFTLSAHAVTMIAALLVAGLVQLDAIALVNRLSLDDSFRDSVRTQAQKLSDQVGSNGIGSNPATGNTDSNTSSASVQNDYYKLLSSAGLIVLPTDASWRMQWNRQRLPGILLSAFLLSLGAPFWYNALQNLLRLRSALAQKDDQQRATRQQTQSSSEAADDRTATVPKSIQGETGNLQAVG